jgi:Flp pilus assembly protein TadG
MPRTKQRSGKCFETLRPKPPDSPSNPNAVNNVVTMLTADETPPIRPVPLGRQLRPRGRQRRGATTVEFAMTAPILFGLVLGAIEFSRANMLVHTASIAATEAARRSIVPGATTNDVRLRALDELAAVGIVDATVSVNPAEILASTDQVTVNLTVPVTMRNGFGLARIFLGRQMTESVTLQREGSNVDIAAETVTRGGMRANGNGNSGSGNSNSNSGSGNSGS